MKNKRIEIKNHQDLNCILSEMIDEFLESMIGSEKYTREPIEEEIEKFEFSDIELGFIYTSKAEALLKRYESRAKKIFSKYFDEDLFELNLYNITYS
ncbi:hypothetical protein [Flavobacterium tructae]|uniref:Uncharacterized protein n=1 Tax=Flavobacterium tructae TaxID=1114873 RepID=A0A1S1J4G6_9FLAO|nr:hypothetical protein [Flavobacterium tructae]OHT44444.1 hypothetical protein BHE19_12045 [Flavobacterium tructae]OXB19420.1 hypothetical protein B0A71_12825 [Flavobacterium tructae]